MQRRFKELLMMCVVCLMLGYTNHGQQEFKFHEVKFRQVLRLSVGSKEGQVFIKVQPNREVIVPRLLPPDAEGNFWIVGGAKGGIMRVKRTGESVTVLRQLSYGLPSVNSSGHLAIHVCKGEGYNYTDEIRIYNPSGQILATFTVKGCPICKHPYLHYLAGIDDQQRIWLQFLSTDRSVEEQPKRTACIVAFDLQGRVVRHIEGVWGLSAGHLLRRTKSVGGSFIILNPENMSTSEVPVPLGWDGLFVGMDSSREIIWWDCWRLDNINIRALMAFGKQGIVAMLPRPYKFLGGEDGKKVLSSEPVIGADGRLYVAQCTEESFYIFEADMSFLKQ